MTHWIGLILLLSLGSGCQKEAVPQVETLVVRYTAPVVLEADQRGLGPEYIAGVHGDQETDLSFKVGGMVGLIGRKGITNDWREGDVVKSGEVLAQLRQEDFLNEMKISQAKTDLASSTFLRTKELWETKAVSQQEYDTALANRRSADASLEQTRQALTNSTLVAPFDATILARYVNLGETISFGRPVLRVADMRTMSVELGVPDTLVGRFQTGNRVPVKIVALEGSPPFEGVVSEVGVAAKSEARLFKVVIKVKNPKGILKSGMTAQVPIGLSRAVPKNALLVPISALVPPTRKMAGQPPLSVYVVRNQQAQELPVETGDLVGSSIIVTSGLSTNDQVVVTGASTLYPGAKVVAKPFSDPFQK
ncbi:MAG: efflux RND transporter periplasmic adaptor subunit [Verrucomicrobiota bacterium]